MPFMSYSAFTFLESEIAREPSPNVWLQIAHKSTNDCIFLDRSNVGRSPAVGHEPMRRARCRDACRRGIHHVLPVDEITSCDIGGNGKDFGERKARYRSHDRAANM